MAQNISLMGADFSAVPSVLLPKTGGGTASFTDVTDTTAAAADVAAGKYFYTASGVRTQGTNSGGGGGGSLTQDANGYLVVPTTGGGGGGSGLEYEEGTWTPTTDSNRPEILFTNTHTATPIMIMMSDATGDYDATTYTNLAFFYMDFELAFGEPFYQSDSTSGTYYVISYNRYRAASATGSTASAKFLTTPSSNTTDSNANYPRYYAKPDRFYPYIADASYWRVGRTYKWIAVWAPST